MAKSKSALRNEFFSTYFLVLQRVQITCMDVKIIYPKYYKHQLYFLEATMNYDSSKRINHGLNHGLFLSIFKFLGCKNILSSNKNKDWTLDCYGGFQLEFVSVSWVINLSAFIS